MKSFAIALIVAGLAPLAALAVLAFWAQDMADVGFAQAAATRIWLTALLAVLCVAAGAVMLRRTKR
ncbi:MAG: hypothetical protein KGL46_11370 [Hyphomicrobiales bacterium]|nr:hypothetical protein [Hyphomicrobiales bacterium]